jgi:cytochrome b561
MNKTHISNIIQTYLATTNTTLTTSETISISKQIRAPMWIWHIYIGYFLVALFAIRFALPTFGFIKFHMPTGKHLNVKKKFQYWIYLLFYMFITVSLITGLLIKFGPEQIKKTMEFIHKLSIYYLIAYIIIHIGGVILAEFTDDKGIISKMISGNNTNN